MSFAEFIANPISAAAIAMLGLFVVLAIGLLCQTNEPSLISDAEHDQRMANHFAKQAAQLAAQRADVLARLAVLDAKLAQGE